MTVDSSYFASYTEDNTLFVEFDVPTLNDDNYNEVLEEMLEAIENTEATNLALVLTGIRHIDTTAHVIFVHLAQALNEEGKIYFVNVQRHVQREIVHTFKTRRDSDRYYFATSNKLKDVRPVAGESEL